MRDVQIRSASARRHRIAIAAIAALLLTAGALHAQQPTASEASAIRAACRSDYMTHCAGVPAGGPEALACLKQNASKVSPPCREALAAVTGAAPAARPAAASAAPASPQSAPAPTTPEEWPHIVSGPAGTATVYQPQVISWQDHRTLDARLVIAITPTGAKAPILGTFEVAFTTETSLAERTVSLFDARLVSSRFPSADTAQAAQFEGHIRAALANLGVKRVPLATVLASLREQLEKPKDVAINNAPPRIFVSTRPSSVVVFDGEPLLAPLPDTSLSFAVNTNWDMFSDSATKTWYLLNNGAWLAAPSFKGPWAPAGKLPPSFASIPDDANFAEVKKQIPGRSLAARDAPTIFVSTTPAEIISSNGPLTWAAIAGTKLLYASNTDAALFRDTAGGLLYFLVSGRWFSAPGVDGPWTFATDRLPADFARIPRDGPRGFVLVSVPNTAEAQEALLEAQIPQQGTLSRATAKLEVAYAGAPKFMPIPGTSMQYAVNTSFNVIQTADVFFSCYQGAWFTGPSPAGPWVLATSVPAVIYTIPPQSPMYPCTYVRVYASTPETVTYGYTSGYAMGFVAAGVVVYGTGYYYPPYVYPAPMPIYYPYPYTYAGARYYNPTTGAWAQGGAIYGPYGGAVKGGTAYNPTTGAWAQGGAVYGPNGGAGAFSAYNPSTGSYAHGSAAWGPGGAAANASWYNANTGRSGSTQQNSNAYGRWGSSTISGPNQTVHTQSQSDARGSAGSFSSSTGAKGAGVSGAGGNRAGAVKTAGGDVYAGADGNAYKKTDSGWEKYDNGSWNAVQKPTAQKTASGGPSNASSAQQRATTSANPSGQTERFGASRASGSEASRFEGAGQLERDREARTMGAERQRQFDSMRGTGGREGFGGRAGGFAGRGGGGIQR